jgi:hypothetical protein
MMAKRLRTMLRHVTQAEIRSPKLPWLRQLGLPPRPREAAHGFRRTGQTSHAHRTNRCRRTESGVRTHTHAHPQPHPQ